MADFRIKRAKSSEQKTTAAPDPETSKSLLAQAGGGAMSGLHTIGSILSTPSRVLWGGINGLAGGEGGFGNMNPFDSTGGIELSHVLGNAGVIAKNDPNKWEWGDLGRGLVDIAGDPTAWAGIGGLTKAGVLASKAGRLTPGLVNSVRAGERGLLSFHHPLATVSHGAIGTGHGVADTLANVGQRTGLTRISNAVAASPPITKMKQLFHASSMGRNTAASQTNLAEPASRDIAQGLNQADLLKTNTVRNMQLMPGGPRAGEAERHMVEMGRTSPELRPLKAAADTIHREKQAVGIATGNLNNTVKATSRIGPRKSEFTHILDDSGNITHTIDNFAQNRQIADDLAEYAWDKIYHGDIDSLHKLSVKDKILPHIDAPTFQDFRDRIIYQGKRPAPKSFLEPNQAVEHAPRFIAEGAEWGGHGSGNTRRAIGTDVALDQKRNEELFGVASTDMINRAFQRAGEHMATLPGHLTQNQVARELGRFIKREFRAEDLRSGTNLTGNYFNDGREFSRPRELGNFIAANPQLATSGPFANHIVHDYDKYLKTGVEQVAKAKNALRFMGEQAAVNHGENLDTLRRFGVDNPPTIRKAAEELGLNAREAGQHAAQHLTEPVRRQVADAAHEETTRLVEHAINQGADPATAPQLYEQMFPGVRDQTILGLHLPVAEYKSLTGYKPGTGFLDSASAPREGFLSSLNTMWKANMLAHPATQVRNAVSAGVTNALQGSTLPLSQPMRHAVDLIRGGEISGYSHIPEVRRLMDSQGIPETEALRRLAAVHFPVSNSIAGDMPAGQVGATLDDLATNVPGAHGLHAPTVAPYVPDTEHINATYNNLRGLGRHGDAEDFLAEQAAIAAQHNATSAASMRGEPTPLHRIVTGPAGALAGYRDGQHVGINAANPAAIERAFGHDVTSFGPAMASNMVARNVEQPMRIGGWLGLLQQGYSADEAARLVGKAQVNYGSREFSDFEKHLKHVIPFYAFSSRAGKHVATELASNPGGRMAQLVKAQDRAHAQDPSLPDSVLSGTALPLVTRDDGTKTFLTGLGLAHEPAVHTLGALAHGDLRGAGYDLLGMTNPLVKSPLEHVTGQSFFQRGEPAGNLDPTVGRLMSNVGVMTGLRDAEAGPVKYPGSSIVEPLVGSSPLSRYATTARALTDTRKSLPESLVNVLTGARITDVSPKKQEATLLRRASELAKSSGAKSREDVYFNKSELAKLQKTDPALAKKQLELQALLNAVRHKSSKKAKDEKGDFRLKKASK